MKISTKSISLTLSLLCSGLCIQGQGDYTYVECTIMPMHESEVHRSYPYIPAPQGTTKTAGNLMSNNWSGYVAATNFTTPAANSVTSVSASWVVPTLVATPDNSYCSIWVGMDGLLSTTVEQIGTSHNWVNGVQQNYAWFEMFPGGSYVISGFPVNPGDVISGFVRYTGNSVFVLTLYNNTQKVYYTAPAAQTTSKTASRNSAEWIVEAPYLNGVLPLSDFANAYMWGCGAIINGVAAQIGNNSWPHMGIDMITTTGAYKDQASPLLPDKGSFFVVWSHE